MKYSLAEAIAILREAHAEMLVAEAKSSGKSHHAAQGDLELTGTHTGAKRIGLRRLRRIRAA